MSQTRKPKVRLKKSLSLPPTVARYKGRCREASLRVPSDIAVMIAAVVAILNAGMIVLAIVAICAIVAMVVFAG